MRVMKSTNLAHRSETILTKNPSLRLASSRIGIFLVLFVLYLAITYSYIENFLATVGMVSFFCFFLAVIIALFRWSTAFIEVLIFKGFCWGFWIIFLLLAPVVQIGQNTFPVPVTFTENDLNLSVLLVTFGTYALFLGDVMGANQFSQNKVRPPVKFKLPFSQSRIHFFSINCFIFTLALIFLTVHKTGISIYFQPRAVFEKSIFDAFGNSTISTIISSVIQVFSLLNFLLILEYYLRVQKNFVRLLYLLLQFLVLIIVCNPISSPRNLVGVVFTSIALVLFKFQPKIIRFAIALTPIFFVLIFPILDFFRYSKSGGLHKKIGIGQLSTNQDYDAFQQLCNTVAHVNVGGFQKGKQILGFFLLFIPRTIWQGKPVPTGPFVAGSLNFEFTNVSSPLPAEGFIDFGIIGVVLYAFCFGLIISKLDNLVRLSIIDNNSFTKIGYFAFLSSYSIIVLRGSLMGVGAAIFVATFFYLVADRFCRTPEGEFISNFTDVRK